MAVQPFSKRAGQLRVSNKRILCLDGDGIGPEVNHQAIRVLQLLVEKGLLGEVQIEKAYLGGIAYDTCGHPLPQETLKLAQEADAVLLGAVGGAKWDSLERSLRPETGLLQLRSGLGLYANLRPASTSSLPQGLSPLREDIASQVDFVVVRELGGGLYFGNPRGQEAERAWNTMVYSKEEILRVAHTGFETARQRSGRLTSVDKANVLEVSQLWRDLVSELASEYPDVVVDHMYVDNAAMQMVLHPERFDVILTENLFGDILSDLSGAVVGSLGVLPSASLGVLPDGRRSGLYEPCHGSAPDIAGQGIANPTAAILSLAMMLRYSLHHAEAAALVEGAVWEALASGALSPDLGGKATTEQVGNAICERVVAHG